MKKFEFFYILSALFLVGLIILTFLIGLDLIVSKPTVQILFDFEVKALAFLSFLAFVGIVLIKTILSRLKNTRRAGKTWYKDPETGQNIPVRIK